MERKKGVDQKISFPFLFFVPGNSLYFYFLGIFFLFVKCRFGQKKRGGRGKRLDVQACNLLLIGSIVSIVYTPPDPRQHQGMSIQAKRCTIGTRAPWCPLLRKHHLPELLLRGPIGFGEVWAGLAKQEPTYVVELAVTIEIEPLETAI